MLTLLLISMLAGLLGGYIAGFRCPAIHQGMAMNLLAGAVGGILAGQHGEMLLMGEPVLGISVMVQTVFGLLGGPIALALTAIVREKVSQ
ncbi:hypothetical protein HBA55_04555 [Pseudomaricurvus alkylphenolicus]|uniref:hypothetical protein n=1 Tax=Pseudomaricurvus alkylphenolicus TaxID=1306991 RepID=UPI001422E871|nr:hypothetical protein [Pseudomaricurvus alkylphenolicus]NIB38843.1 hypothetical protein [Pseudomaricurvus alkylphenolicus]